MAKNSVGERIKMRREAKNLTQEQLASEIGVSQMMVSYYERDFKKPTLEIAGRIAKTLNVTIDYLAGI